MTNFEFLDFIDLNFNEVFFKNLVKSTLFDLRLSLGLSQRQFCKLVDVDPKAYSKWERGLSLPSFVAFARIVSKYLVFIEALVESDRLNPYSRIHLDFNFLFKHTKTVFNDLSSDFRDLPF